MTTQALTQQCLPCDPDAEAALLGSMMVDSSVIPAVVNLLDPDESDWFIDGNDAMIFNTLVGMHDRGTPVDLVTVKDELLREGVLEKIGGVSRLMELSQSVPSAANAEHYARIVRDLAIRRRRIVQAERDQQAAYDLGTPITDTLPDAPGPGWVTIGEVGREVGYNIGFVPVTTGYASLDHALRGGFRPEGLYPLAGRTGAAKSTLALNMARRQALAGVNVLFFKLEESVIEAVYRTHAATAQVRLKVLLDGARGAGQADQERLADAWDALKDLPIRFADCRSIDAIERVSRRHVQNGGQIVYIDQLTMVEVPDTAIGYERATAVSNRLRVLARGLHVPIVVVCQVNRPASKQDGHLSCHDLRDSGAIENDASAVLLVDRAHDPDGPQYSTCDPIKYLQILVGKNRYGPCTDADKPIELVWHPTICRIEDADLSGGGR